MADRFLGGRSADRRDGDGDGDGDRALVVIIGGPTASGKSALALDVARAFDGTIINADSMQVYAELSILTARPAAADLALAPHRLYGTLSAQERCTAALWRDQALTEIGDALAAGRLPIVVGGTGLYLRALIEGLAPIPRIPEPVRAQARALHGRIGAAGLHAEIARDDPPVAARLAPGDSQRLIRAWEVLRATGRSISWWQSQPGDGPPPGLRFLPIVVAPPRGDLYAACDARFRVMIERGAVTEVAALSGLDPDLPAMKALGVPELRRHLAGDIDLDTAVAAAQQATRRYAKRQATWFRHQVAERYGDADRTGAVHTCHVMTAQYSEIMTPEIFSIIRKTS